MCVCVCVRANVNVCMSVFVRKHLVIERQLCVRVCACMCG